MIATTSVFQFATSHEICAILGARVRIQRRIQRLSQGELAALAGIALTDLRALEVSGVASVDVLVRVARALGLTGGFIDLMWPEPCGNTGGAQFDGIAKRLCATSRGAGAG